MRLRQNADRPLFGASPATPAGVLSATPPCDGSLPQHS